MQVLDEPCVGECKHKFFVKTVNKAASDPPFGVLTVNHGIESVRALYNCAPPSFGANTEVYLIGGVIENAYIIFPYSREQIDTHGRERERAQE